MEAVLASIHAALRMFSSPNSNIALPNMRSCWMRITLKCINMLVLYVLLQNDERLIVLESFYCHILITMTLPNINI